MSAAQENTVTDAQSQFEDWYAQNAFDYAANPIGSRDCGLMRRAWHAALAARPPVPDHHPDDLAVDAFAAAMKAKMAEARAKGRSGWDDPEQCSVDELSRMLRHHVEKGDPRDVANFCMMLWNRQEGIATQVGEVQGDALQLANQWRHVFDGDGHDMAGANKNTLRRFVQAIDALAARQPGAQVPDAYLVQALKDGEAWEHRRYIPRWGDPDPSALAGTVYEIRGKKHPELGTYSVKPFYAAPPAQGIDLGHARVIEMLLTLAETAYNLADNANDMAECENVDYTDFVAMSDALDALDQLPDDQPGYAMSEPAKARWALRALLDQRDAAPGVGS